MIENIKTWLQNRYHIIIHSIAFFPVLIGFLFLFISFAMIRFDFTDFAKNLKSNYEFLNLTDAETARSIVAAIVTGIISLTVFSFSLVMIVLNQAASNLSNRVLDNLIGNRRQQIILGCYIGTIVYSFFLLTAIRGESFGDRIPAISVYTGIMLVIIDIFLFIYFLHYVTQSIKFDVVIRRIYNQSKLSLLSDRCDNEEKNVEYSESNKDFTIYSNFSGVYEGFNPKRLLSFCKDHDIQLKLLHLKGSYLLRETPLLLTSKKLSKEEIDDLLTYVYIVKQESIEENYLFGVRQLREIAVKALSPGINDPGTAIESLKALFQLFQYFLEAPLCKTIYDDDDQPKIYMQRISFEELFDRSIPTIWSYGKDDKSIVRHLSELIDLLYNCHKEEILKKFGNKIKEN